MAGRCNFLFRLCSFGSARSCPFGQPPHCKYVWIALPRSSRAKWQTSINFFVDVPGSNGHIDPLGDTAAPVDDAVSVHLVDLGGKGVSRGFGQSLDLPDLDVLMGKYARRVHCRFFGADCLHRRMCLAICIRSISVECQNRKQADWNRLAVLSRLHDQPSRLEDLESCGGLSEQPLF